MLQEHHVTVLIAGPEGDQEIDRLHTALEEAGKEVINTCGIGVTNGSLAADVWLEAKSEAEARRIATELVTTITQEV
jgi:hypothetical protein